MPAAIGNAISRRSLLLGATLAGIAIPLGQGIASASPEPSLLTRRLSTPPIPMAMHIHASFSEGGGSMAGQLCEAQANGVEVVWWTEHLQMMNARTARSVVHFDSLDHEAERTPYGVHLPWVWTPQEHGNLIHTDGGIVSSPVSPRDPSPIGALKVEAVGAGPSVSGLYYYADAGLQRSQRSSVNSLTLSIDVFPQSVGVDAWMEILIDLSYQPAVGSRPAGRYRLAYRLGGVDSPSSFVAGLVGVVQMPVKPESWNTFVLSPRNDFARLWPDLLADDNSLYDLWLGVTSRNGMLASGVYDYLLMNRPNAGQGWIDVQGQLADRLQTSHATIYQIAADEVAYPTQEHENWLGARDRPIDFNKELALGVADGSAAAYAHSFGGLVSYNHPFGVGSALTPAPTDQQDAARVALAQYLLNSRAGGSDILEVGYRLRGSATLEEHLELWDTCSRNGLLLTGNGVSDNHMGLTGMWQTDENRFITYAWATAKTTADLMTALRRGQVYVGELGSFSGTLNLIVEGTAQMGSVSVVSGRDAWRVLVLATGIPRGGRVDVVQGPVDYAGPDAGGASVIARLTNISGWWSGLHRITVSTPVSSYLRTNVVNAEGQIVGFSNPVWLMREPLRGGVPVQRQGVMG